MKMLGVIITRRSSSTKRCFHTPEPVKKTAFQLKTTLSPTTLHRNNAELDKFLLA
tara:strand:- start:584 stop:748 length:165 start_codon:yes stop_codon:yes gene_type:complete